MNFLNTNRRFRTELTFSLFRIGLIIVFLTCVPLGNGSAASSVGSVRAQEGGNEGPVLYLPFITAVDNGNDGNSSVLETRPYSSSSVWNTPIGQDPVYDPHSADMIATIGLSNEGEITSNTDNYSYTIYYADESTPRWDIPCLVYRCTIVTPEGITRTTLLKGVPIPTEAMPSGGDDAQMIVIDKINLTEYDFWGVTRISTGWEVRNASVYNLAWDGTPEEYSSRGSGIPYMAGLIRPWEIRQGHIDHIIAFAYPYPTNRGCVFPASKTDGFSDLPYALPEGARLQLDPSLTEADFDTMGLSPTGKIIARALQAYGMVLVNISGRPKIYAENLNDNPYAKISWSDPDLKLGGNVIANIPYTSFRVLALPSAYWNPSPSAFMHGSCYAYP